jgi:hypothetical protein
MAEKDVTLKEEEEAEEGGEVHGHSRDVVVLTKPILPSPLSSM